MTTSTDPTELKLLQIREQIQKHIKNPMKDGNNLFNALISPGPASITLLQINNNTLTDTTKDKMKENSSATNNTNHNSNNNNNNLLSNTNSSSNRSLSTTSSSNLSADSSFERLHMENGSNYDRFKNYNNSNNNDPKGLVAAAAISLAVTKPFPLKKFDKTKTFKSGNTNDSSKNKNKLKRNNLKHNHGNNSHYKENSVIVDDSYILPQTTNIISCFCGKNDPLNINKDSIIQCNNCHRWQHLNCFNLKNKFEILPINFYCKICKPKWDINNYRIFKKRKITSLLNSNNSLIINTMKNNSSTQKDEDNKHINTNKSNINILNTNTNTNTNNNNNILSVKLKQENFNIPINSSVCGTNGETDNLKLNTHKDPFTIYINNNNDNKNSKINGLSIDQCSYGDKYVKQFIDMHNNDDWVLTQNKEFNLPNLEDIISIKNISEIKNSNDNTVELKGVYSKQRFTQNTNIIEIIGLIDFQKNYILDSDNQYRIWGTTQSGVYFHPHWPLFIDCRKNDTTVPAQTSNLISSTATPSTANLNHILNNIRKSCKPNITLRTIKTNNNNDVKFILTTTRDIDADEELTINWQWDLRHPINKLIMDSNQINKMNDMDKFWLVHSVDTIWCKCSCACYESCSYIKNNNDLKKSSNGSSKENELSCPLLRAKLFSDQFHKDLQQQKFK